MTPWPCTCFRVQSMSRLNTLGQSVSLLAFALSFIPPSTASPQLMPNNGTYLVNATSPITNITSAAKSGFVRTSGASFELGGKPFTFGGSNLWQMGFTSPQFAEQAVKNAQDQELSVLRIAAWNEKDPAHGIDPGATFFQEWTNGKPTINDGPNGLQLLDQAVQAAEAANIKLILCLTNEWPNYGGMDTYTKNILGDAGFTHTSFYTNQQVISAFKTYISHVVARYKSSPAVLSWELANEARCEEANCQGSDVLTHWADDISTYIKSLDSNHLVTFGGYGYFNNGHCANNCDFAYDGDSGEDYTAILKLPNIDFGTLHLYTNPANTAGEAYGLQWFKDHNDASMAANKPMIVEELGVGRQNAGLDQVSIMETYEKFLVGSGAASAIGGVLLWSSDVMGGACPLDGDPFAICQSDPQFVDLVTGFMGSMAAKGGGTTA